MADLTDGMIETTKYKVKLEISLSGEIFFKRMVKPGLELALTEKLPKPSKTSPLLNKIFSPGETNPMLFLNKLQKCIDVKTDKDKMFAIRKFVDDNHRIEFSEKCFTSDWPTIKKLFLEKSYVENMKRELNIDFNYETTLRSFLDLKLSGFSKFTTLPLLNQMEMVLNDLPTEISYLFIKNEKMTGSKDEILEFCDAIQDLVATMRKPTEEESRNNQDLLNHMNNKDPLYQMKEFNFDPDLDSETSSHGKSSTGRGGKRGHPPKNISGSSSNYNVLDTL